MTELLVTKEMTNDYKSLEKMDVQELNIHELIETQGGILLGIAFFSAVVGFIIGNIAFN